MEDMPMAAATAAKDATMVAAAAAAIVTVDPLRKQGRRKRYGVRR